MELRVEDYLSEEEMKKIAEEEFRMCVSRIFSKEKDIERVISNASFGVIWSSVDELFGSDSKKLLAERVKNQIENLSTFGIFKKPDVWDAEPNNTYTYLQEVLMDNKPRIKEIVEEGIEPATLRILKEDMVAMVSEAIEDIYRKL